MHLYLLVLLNVFQTINCQYGYNNEYNNNGYNDYYMDSSEEMLIDDYGVRSYDYAGPEIVASYYGDIKDEFEKLHDNDNVGDDDDDDDDDGVALFMSCIDVPPSESRACSSRPSERRYFYNETSARCESFTWHHCNFTTNMFKTATECVSKCVYQSLEYDIVDNQNAESPPPNPTQFKIEETSVDKPMQHVVKFANNVPFQMNVKADSKLDSSICSQSIDTGPCRAFIPSYGYDSEQRQCVLFIYGGCLGSENRFPTRELCQQTCRGGFHIKAAPDSRQNADSMSPICNSARYTDTAGRNCNVAVAWPMFQFNIQTGLCEKFTYTGCS